MAFSNSSNQYPYKIYVSTISNSGYNKDDDQSLESPLITFTCNVKLSFISDKPNRFIPSFVIGNHDSIPLIPSSIIHHDSNHEFKHHITDVDDDQPTTTRDFISNIFSDTGIIPFPLENLHWQERVYDKESVPLMSIDNVVTSLSDVCRRMVRESSRKKLDLLVYIAKKVIVPHDEFLAMHEERKKQQVLSDVQAGVWLHAQHGWSYFRQSDREDMINLVRGSGLSINSMREALELIRENATRASTEQALKDAFVPAAENSIRSLEKVIRCEHSNSGDKCPVCLENMLMGSQLIRLPCSHIFHDNCILQWLKTGHMCPLCRFELPTE